MREAAEHFCPLVHRSFHCEIAVATLRASAVMDDRHEVLSGQFLNCYTECRRCAGICGQYFAIVVLPIVFHSVGRRDLDAR